MANSPEYPDLPWVPPKSWTKGRASGQPTLIVIHTTEGSEGLKSAEDGAAYDTRRIDGVSTHYFHDQDTTIQCVRTTDRAHTARATGNERGIHHELCGRAAQSPEQWRDAASKGTIRNAARQAARDAKKYDIPVRRLTVAQVRAGERGFCEHKTISDAFGETDHQDPGKNYPWTSFLAMVQEEMEDGVSQADVIAALKSEEGRKAITSAVFRTDDVLEAPPEHAEGNDYWAALSYLKDIQARTRRTENALAATSQALLAAIQAVGANFHVDEQKLGQSLAAGVVALLPVDTDDITVEELTLAIRNLVAPVV